MNNKQILESIRNFTQQLIKEEEGYKKSISNIISRLSEELPKDSEINESGLLESMELIGDGEITIKDEDRIMYVEYLKNDTLILVVHGRLTWTPLRTKMGYDYEIGLYRNQPEKYQIGGGYGASGIIGVRHPIIFKYYDENLNYMVYNKEIISMVIEKIKQKI